MPRHKKELTVVSPRAKSGLIVPVSILRALANGLFGRKKKYHPSPQEIADYYLTPREREVAYLAALGFTEVEIADALGLTFQTVRTHLRAVLTKMDLDDPRALCEYFAVHATDSTD